MNVIRGDATPEEIAALVAVLSVRRAAPERHDAPSERETWRNPARSLRSPLSPGKSAWRLSALP
ncbi:acyl-CoA carboxylase subunit epsilon [Nonomuraea longicatena]|uniref:acyl-CoA carboxylase subunit epsilon n=1 Tax=Nonomuraea longicatena TaxID=83682 RepID=UPI0031D98DE3